MEGVDIEHFEISSHAFERFLSRHKAIKGVSFAQDEALDTLHTLLLNSRPEEEKKILERRRLAHDGDEEYLINPPWRFVLSGKRLITCEITPERIMVVSNPHPKRIRASFFVRVEENPEERSTRMVKSLNRDFSWYIPSSELYLPELVEINAIIRSLRMIGVRVDYERTGTEAKKSAILEVAIPQDFPSYRVNQLPDSRKIAIVIGIDDELLPRGFKDTICAGITKFETEQVLKFLLDEEWSRMFQGDKTLAVIRDTSLSPEMRLRSLGTLNLSIWPISKTKLVVQGEITLSGGNLVFQSLQTGRSKKKTMTAVCQELLNKIAVSLTGRG